MSLSRHAGFAMLDVLVALLLLSITLTGTCTILVQSMRATHDALLATRAVDLAADLSEDLQGASSRVQVDALLAEWRSRVRAALPVAGMEAEEFASLSPLPPEAGEPDVAAAARHELVLHWRGGADASARELRLPVSYGAQAW